jgi:hypothetical protein
MDRSLRERHPIVSTRMEKNAMASTALSRITTAQEAFNPKVMSFPGVFATGIGFKRVAGVTSDVMAICIHVVKKRPLSELPIDERIPDTIDGFPTDVVEGQPPSLCGDDGKYRPLKGGIEIGVRFKYGTAGCMVKTKPDKNGKTLICALSNAHVLDEKDTRTFQPAIYVVGDRIGNTLKSTTNSLVDCAMTDLTYWDDSGIGVIAGIGQVRGTRVLEGPGVRVMKRGARTLLTVGTVSNINLTVQYPNGTWMTKQILIDYDDGDFADSGDSGSVIVDFDNNVIGLLWGISSNGTANRGVASPIGYVLAELDVDLVTVSDASEIERPRRATPLERIAPLFSLNARGQQIWRTFAQGDWELSRLIERTPQLYAMWLSLPQEEVLEALFEGAADPDSAIPAKVGALDTAELLYSLRNMLSKYVESRSARRQLDDLYLDIIQNIGNSWRTALGDADRSPASRSLPGGNGGAAARRGHVAGPRGHA